jgi:hypothetical protein
MIKINDKILTDSELWDALEAVGDPLSVGASTRLRELHNDLSSVHTSLSKRLTTSEAALSEEKEKAKVNEYYYRKRMNLLIDAEKELMRMRQQAPALIAQHLEMSEALAAAVARAERAESDVNIFKAHGKFCPHIVGDGLGNPTRCTIREDYKAAAYTANDALAQVRDLKEELEVALSVAKSAVMERDKIAAARDESIRDFAAVYNREITARSADGFTRTRPLTEWAEAYIHSMEMKS